jgi:RNA polymerase sigma factor (TIGR02999 family)
MSVRDRSGAPRGNAGHVRRPALRRTRPYRVLRRAESSGRVPTLKFPSSMPSLNPTQLLTEWRNGSRAALDQLFPLVYEDLRRRARAQLGGREGHTLTTTALVHETYLKLIAAEHVSWQDRAHFLALASMAMRQVLVSYARRNLAAKRGGGAGAVSLDEVPILTDTGADDLLALDEALEKLCAVEERLSKTVEMRFFGGLSIEETAEALNVSVNTVKRDWDKAKVWLIAELAGK